jgi:signal transduction histidine kinase
MFSRFFRAKNATNIKGTGLGLTIVKRYADLMGAEVTFESELNQGATFFVNFKSAENGKNFIN